MRCSRVRNRSERAVRRTVIRITWKIGLKFTCTSSSGANKWACEGMSERSEQCGARDWESIASEWVSFESEWVSRRASGQLLTSDCKRCWITAWREHLDPLSRLFLTTVRRNYSMIIFKRHERISQSSLIWSSINNLFGSIKSYSSALSFVVKILITNDKSW